MGDTQNGLNGLLFLGKIEEKTPYLLGKSMVSCICSLKPIHWDWFCNGKAYENKMIWSFPKMELPIKSSIFPGFYIINHLFWSTPHDYGNLHMTINQFFRM